MLAKPNRLRLGRDIDRVFRQGRYGGNNDLTAKVLTGSGPSRAVVVVPKKVSKKAVVRNRIRRRLIEVLAASWQQIRPGCDIVVTVKHDLSDSTNPDLTKSLFEVLTKAGAIK